MKVIRRGVFETNSSSTHSITLCTKEEYEKWKKGEFLFDEYEEKIVPVEETKIHEDNLIAYGEYFNDYSMETFEVEYITPQGEKIVAFGKYGFDG